MTDNERTVILFGAGAAYAWGGAKTADLTTIIRETGFNCIDNQTKITEFIYKTLIQDGHNPENITFETIIDVIEGLISYYSKFDQDFKTLSLQSSFFDSKFHEAILNFSVEGGEVKHGFRLEIPKGERYEWQHSGANNGETPEQYFFQQLLARLLTSINSSIGDYAYHTAAISKVLSSTNEEINDLFQRWVKNLYHDGNIIRMYTLNYDRIFKILALECNIGDVYEGFNCGSILAPEVMMSPDVPRILKDFSCHCHYNLHGSVFWKIEPRDNIRFSNSEIFLIGYPRFQINLGEQPYFQVNTGKTILLSNIVTGYQKAEKGFITPFKQMQAAFDQDCCFTKKMYIIGYSFSDMHINLSIRTAMKYNPNIKIHIIDPVYTEDNGGYTILCEQFRKVFTDCLFNRGHLNKISDKCCEYFDGKITVYSIGMDEFLASHVF